MTMTSTASARPAVAAWILGNSSVRVWGLTGVERLERQLRLLEIDCIERGAIVPAKGPVLVLDSNWIFDDRTLASMIKSPATGLEVNTAEGKRLVAANVAAEQASPIRAVIEGTLAPGEVSGLKLRDSATLEPTYVKKVLRSNRPLVLRARAERTAVLERHLFDEAYKSVTDLVTKFVWPRPAYRVVRACVRLGIGPNAVTAVSLMLVLTVMWLFAEGRFATGLAAAWLMTFLDTVDGKLARVTVTSTRIGHNFDHGIDLIHPPLWYTAWAFGLAGDGSVSPTDPILVAIYAAYIAGRVFERSFTRIIAGFSIFSWRPFDSFFRLITGRRNSNLLLLTGFAAFGRPDLGLEMVAVWTVVSTIVLGTRVAQAISWKSRNSTLQPWIVEVGSDMSLVPRYARSFTAKPTAASTLAD